MRRTGLGTRIRASIPHPATAVAGLVFLCHVLLLSGCARPSEVAAMEDEVRLAGDATMSIMPRYSPDGRWVAFSFKPAQEGAAKLRVGLVPVEGGDVQTVYSDSLAALVLGWRPDSRAVFALTIPDLRLREIGLDGRILRVEDSGILSRPVDISRDGKRMLVPRFNGDNYDIGILDWAGDTGLHLVNETPAWELDGCFGPGRKEITFVRQDSHRSATSEIVIRNLSTGQEQVLPLPDGKHSAPDWSADGRYLCYTSEVAGNEDVWIYDTVDGREVRVTASPENETEATWAPDGERISYTRHSQTSHLVLTRGDTRERTQITDGDGVDVWPSLSPDGDWVAFVRRLEGANDGPHLCVVSASGGEVATLDLDGLRISAEETVMSWSANSREIAFSAEDATGNLDVYVIARDGGLPRRVTITPGMDMAPVWSPDGKSIGFTRVAGGETQVWTIPATGGLPTQVSRGNQLTQMSVWSPDSRRIAYQVVAGDNRNELWVSDAALRMEPVRIAVSDNLLLWPVGWSADGQEVLAYRVMEDRSILTAIRVADLQEKELGVIDDGNLFNFGVRWNAGAEAYQDRIYRNGNYVSTDGSVRAEIVSVRVAEHLRPALSAMSLAGGSQ